MYVILSTVKMQVKCKVSPVYELSGGQWKYFLIWHFMVVSGQLPTSAALFHGKSSGTN